MTAAVRPEDRPRRRETRRDAGAGTGGDAGTDGAAAVLEAVSEAARELLRSLPERPERLRVRAAGVCVELDWRPTAGAAAPAPAAAPAGAPAPAEPARSGLVPVPDLAPAGPDVHFVCAPSVGAFYRSPEPGAAPFVAPGAEVRAGQQVAIVEVMKLMLPVEADRAGTVVDFLVEDGTTVEFGERLISLAPAAGRTGV